MSEKIAREVPLTIVNSEEIVVMGLGMVVRSEIVFGDVPRIIYSPKLPDIGFKDYVKDVVSAEKAAMDPNVIQDLKNKKGTTPEQLIEDGSCEFIEDLRAGTYSPKEKSLFLDALVKQRANQKLFDEAKRANKHRAKVF